MAFRTIMLGAAALALTATASLAADMPGGIKAAAAAGGEILTDSKGMTLYIFDNDKPGVSNCVDACAANWPPLAATAGAEGMGDFTVIKRPDGSMQWAHKGMPLYTWVKDQKPGDVTGDGVKNVWHLARP